MSKFKKGDRAYLKGHSDLIVTVVSKKMFGDVLVEMEDGETYTFSEHSLTPCHPLDYYTLPQVIAHFGAENIIDELDGDRVMDYLEGRISSINK